MIVMPIEAEISSASNDKLFDEAVDAVVEKTGCTAHEAIAAVRFVEEKVGLARHRPLQGDCRAIYHFDDHGDIDTESYALLERIMLLDQMAEPESAHQAIEAYVLYPGERLLMHRSPSGHPFYRLLEFTCS